MNTTTIRPETVASNSLVYRRLALSDLVNLVSQEAGATSLCYIYQDGGLQIPIRCTFVRWSGAFVELKVEQTIYDPYNGEKIIVAGAGTYKSWQQEVYIQV